MNIKQPYHPGEIAVQEQSGESRSAMRNGTVIADRIIPGALNFIAQQSMIVLGSLADDQSPWASVLFGDKGFASAEEGTVAIQLPTGRNAADPLWRNIAANRQLGMLFIELATRRRLRVNGSLRKLTDTTLELSVEEAYPNCPKYIQRRHLRKLKPAAPISPAWMHQGVGLNDRVRRFIQAADTLFVASAHPERGLDVSHRGGQPGFVKIRDAKTLRIPDYAGNSMFNTLGNIAVNPRAGLLFIDFESGDVLQITGSAEVRFDLDDPQGETGGTRRFWDFTPAGWLLSAGAAGAEWEFLDYSPFLPGPREESHAS